MARAFLEVRDMGTNRVTTRVDLAISTVSDFRPVWRAFRRPWYATRKEMAETLGRSTGTPWRTYRQTAEKRQYQYIKAKIVGRRASTLKPLHWEGAKGRLLPSLYEDRHPDAVWRERPQDLTIGTRVPYATNHNRGVGYSPMWRNLRRYRIPKRPLFGFGRRALHAINNATSEHAGRAASVFGRTEVGFSSSGVRRML